LTPRDKHANNLATALDFANPDTSSPTYDVPPFTSAGCTTAEDMEGPEYAEWPALRDHLLATGWKLPR
jgi:hypothetical protein